MSSKALKTRPSGTRSSKPLASRPAARDAAATRAAILDSAERVFARDGLRGTRTEEIAVGSGVTKAMIHYYFSTKEALYQAVLERVFEERERGLDFATLRKLPPAEALRTFVERLLQQMCAKPHLGPLFALENIQNDGAFYTRHGGKIYSTLTEIIERGVADACFRPQDPRHAAVNVMGACVHFFNVSSNIRAMWPRSGAAELMKNHAVSVGDFVMHALLAVPARAARRGSRKT